MALLSHLYGGSCTFYPFQVPRVNVVRPSAVVGLPRTYQRPDPLLSVYPRHCLRQLPPVVITEMSSSSTERSPSPEEKSPASPPARAASGTNSSPSTPIINFSIDGILGLTGREEARVPAAGEASDEAPKTSDAEITSLSSISADGALSLPGMDDPRYQFSWLQCTRYKPPKLPRAKRKDGSKKRKLGRNPRVPFSAHQVATLESKFRRTHYLSSVDVSELSVALNLSENRVKIWFQNRRARERRERENREQGRLQAAAAAAGVPLPAVTWPESQAASHGSPTASPTHQYVPAVGQGTSAFTPVPFTYGMD
ncbi:PREDICTED: homeobox protein vab-15-like [Branchiostoma belcheri]|uniref:Homeobox protein vab-15-like n=1 Tax=Branchiostoma belcheri TaxID=7741 RepID=A0A6P4ZMP0_BRABE|nr:PREDICTED: homeobox protein vab-15-like [Branchiostoma belcheri]KAI8484331.1 hypothetical protein Bbelb_379290 [Branchiostoma belcheri]